MPVEWLCDRHLVAEHGELHALWSVLTNHKNGYSRHPETLRWEGKLKALYLRHGELTHEMKLRGFKHNSTLPFEGATGSEVQDEYLQTPDEQVEILKGKACGCPRIKPD